MWKVGILGLKIRNTIQIKAKKNLYGLINTHINNWLKNNIEE